MTNALFKPVSWMTKIDLINRLVLNNNVLMTVLADNNGGKTTFFQLLQESLDKAILPVFFSATPLFDEQVLLREIAYVCGFEMEGELTLTSVVSEINKSQQNVLLMIDDAQHLPMVYIESLLMHIKNEGEPGYFHVCLASEYSLVETLNKLASGAYQNMIHGLELGALNQEETKAYVMTALSGKKPYKKALTDDNIKEFYDLTEGYIAGINSQMEGYFFNKAQQRGFRLPVSKELVATALGVLVVSTGAVFIWQAQDIKSTDDTDMVLAVAAPIAYEEMAQEQGQYVSQIANMTEGAKIQSVQVAALTKKAQEAYSKNSEDEAYRPDLVVMDKVVVVPKTVAVKPKPALVAKVAPVAKAPVVAAQSAVRGGALSGAYTIQVIASRNLQDVKRFSLTHRLPGKPVIMQSTRQGQTWYVLTLGQYKAREDAKRAIGSLPSDVAALKPWARPVSELSQVGR